MSTQDEATKDPQSFEANPMEIPSDTPSEKLPSRRLHIMGLGSIGTFVAHSLKNLPNAPPLTLLMHRQEMYEDFKKKARIIRLVKKDTDVNDEQSGFDVDLMSKENGEEAYWTFIPHLSRQRQPNNPVQEAEKMESGELFIHSLIVAVKGTSTVPALRDVKHRVNARTTICFIQNGMGQIEELNEKVFTDPSTRPTYMLGIISHGVHLRSNFNAIHAGFGTTALGIYRDPDKFPRPPKSLIPSSDLSAEDRRRYFPTDDDLYSNITSRYLLRQITRSPILTATPFKCLDLVQLQLEKLAVNCVLNPITALLDVRNGATLNNAPLGKVERLLIAEISLVMRNLPELEAIPGVKARFASDRLEALFLGAAKKTAANSSSTREDIRKFRKTELDYINGYVVKRGEEQGVKCVLNFMITQLVKAKEQITQKEQHEVLPYGTTQVMSRFDEKTGKVMIEDITKTG